VRYRSLRLNGSDAMERAAVRAQGMENAAIVGSVRVRCPKRGALFVRDQSLDCSVPMGTRCARAKESVKGTAYRSR
jgi:hypothetical protein